MRLVPEGGVDVITEIVVKEIIMVEDKDKVEDNSSGLCELKDKTKYFDFPSTSNPEIDKFQKRILAFSKQYGAKNEKTTSMHMSYLEAVREAGINCLKGKQISKACSFFADCLSFTNPVHDEVFYQKFLLIKIDALSKLLFCILQLDGCEFRRQHNTFTNQLTFVIQFTQDLKRFPKYDNLLKNEHCLLQLTYFYLGLLYYRTNSLKKAIEGFQTAETIIKNKLNAKIKNEQSRNLLQTILTKTYYKLSKCYCQQQMQEKQQEYEVKALKGAREVSDKLFIYIHRNIKMHQKKKEFQQLLSKLDGRKKIEEQMLRVIEEVKQNNVASLYDVYLHTPAKVAATNKYINKTNN